ncbi:27321_t:CDS:2 [Gigaspora margarita]|uniref:27321_t:CDS:1 n=1 Tax=Gigaspora margarita TaxID=4874 RepID=A0ABN7UTD7_GIGMA|nr:27321_t:CDS:2 [Gigaspora margarita]
MSSIFISFCFAKTVSETDNFINRTALYQVAINNDQLSELTFKGYTSNPDSLVISFEKNAIVLMLSLVQATPVLSPDPNYIPTSMIFHHLYLYLFILLCLEKQSSEDSAFCCRKIKISSNNIPHIIASEIEWTYLSEGQSPSACNKSNSHSREDLDLHFDSIEKKYAFLNSTPFQKKQPTSLHSLFTKKSTKDNVSPINLMDILSQIQNKTASTTSTPPNINSVSPSSNAHHTPQTATNINESFLPEIEDNTAPDLDTEFITPIYEDPTPEPPAKCKKHTLSSRKK